jgi:hypothetical protein
MEETSNTVSGGAMLLSSSATADSLVRGVAHLDVEGY